MRLREGVADAGLDVWRRSSYILNLSRGDWPKRANALGAQVAEGKNEAGCELELELLIGIPDIRESKKNDVRALGGGTDRRW